LAPPGAFLMKQAPSVSHAAAMARVNIMGHSNRSLCSFQSLAVFLLVLPQGAGALLVTPSHHEPEHVRGSQAPITSNATLPTQMANGSHAQSLPRSAVSVARSVAAQPQSFRSFMNNYKYTRGVWEWDHALDVFEWHVAQYGGTPTKIAEVGVHSGGSLLMWLAVLGPTTHVYGIDTDPASKSLNDATTTITVGDPGDCKFWNAFYGQVVPTLDVMVYDGDNLPKPMLTTLTMSFPQILPGGAILYEEIYGSEYLKAFFEPAAELISNWAEQGLVHSVHIYPYMLVIHKKGGQYGNPNNGPETVAASSSDFASMWTAVSANPGQRVALKNDAWGSFFSKQSLAAFFGEFIGLYEYRPQEQPAGCSTSASATSCTKWTANSVAQTLISGVHIRPARLVVDVQPSAPLLRAVRRGSDWLPRTKA